MSLYNDASLLLIPSGYKSGKLYTQKPTDGSGDLTFTRASDATRVNSDGFIEKGRENLLLQSNSFDTTWTLNNSSLTGGQSGYDGSNDAWKLTSTSTSSARVQQFESNTGVQSLSIYAKAGTANFIIAEKAGTNGYYAWFDLSNGTIGNTSGDINTTIENVGNGWYRCSISGNPSASSKSQFFVVDANGSTAVTNGATIYIQDAQLEQSLVATEYIPTTTAAVSVGMTANVPRLDYTNSSCPALKLEPQRTNLFTYSEYFADTDWSKTRSSVELESVLNPGNTLATYYFKEDNQNGSHEIFQGNKTITAGSLVSVSIFFKRKTGSADRFLRLQINDNTFTDGARVLFDIQNGTIAVSPLNVGSGTEASAKVEAFANGWYRASLTCKINNTSTIARSNIYLQELGTGYSAAYLGDDISGCYIWGAQLEEGSYPTSYIPTLGTSVTRVADSCYKTGISSLIGQTEGTIFMDFVLDSVDGGNDFRFDITEGASYDNEIFVGMTNGDLRALIRVSASNVYDSGNISATVGTRYKMALAYANNDVAFYVNGTQENTSSSATIPSTDEITIGNRTHNKEMVLKESLNQAILFKTRLSNTDCEVITSEGYDSYSAMATALNYTVL